MRKYHLWQLNPPRHLSTAYARDGSLVEYNPKTEVILDEAGCLVMGKSRPFVEEDAGRHPSYDEGIKFDETKNRLDLIPVEALEQVGEIYSYGSRKYADSNWRKGLKFSRLYGAALRHLFAFWRGEDKDKESGLPHLAHATFGLLGLLQYQAEGRRQLDDRFQWERGRTESPDTLKVGGEEAKEPVREVGLSRETEALVAEQAKWHPAFGLATRL